MSGSPSHPPPSGRDTISAHIYLPPQARCLENLIHGATRFVLSARLWCSVTSNLANSVRRMKNCCAVHLIMYLLLKTSRKASPRIQTHHRSPCYPYSFEVQHSRGESQVLFCYRASSYGVRGCTGSKRLNTVIACPRETLKWTEGDKRGVWWEDCVSTAPLAGQRKGVLRGCTPIFEVRTLSLLLFPFTARLSPMVSFSALCILNSEWNANVTFTFSKVCWKWTAMCREHLVWRDGTVRREKVITSKRNLTHKKKKKKNQAKFLT